MVAAAASDQSILEFRSPKRRRIASPVKANKGEEASATAGGGGADSNDDKEEEEDEDGNVSGSCDYCYVSRILYFLFDCLLLLLSQFSMLV